MTMDYSPWSEREIWPFLKVAVSPKPKRSRLPKLVCMHLISSIYSCIKFFDDHGIAHSEREIWSFLKVAISPKLEYSHPPKLVYMHLTFIPTCMNFLSRF